MATRHTGASGQYVLHDAIASGGMATVHVARLVGQYGLGRIVAAKRLHPRLAKDPEFLAMFRDEAHIASTIRHPNVVSVLDVALSDTDVILVQEYVHGVSLDALTRVAEARGEAVDPTVAAAVASAIARGLHAAHEARDPRGEPLHVVHRDVSPHNVLVGADGAPRLVDFGIAKARSSSHVTRQGMFKGKLGYASPEQLRGIRATRSSDIYSVGVVLWELLVGRRIHAGCADAGVVLRVCSGDLPDPMEALEHLRQSIPRPRWAMIEALTPVVMRALAPTPAERFATADAFADAIVLAVTPASSATLSRWVHDLGGETLAERSRALAVAHEANVESAASLTPIAWPQSVPPPAVSHDTSGAAPAARWARSWVPLVAGLVIGLVTAAGTGAVILRRAGAPLASAATGQAALLAAAAPIAASRAGAAGESPRLAPLVPLDATDPATRELAPASPAKPAAAIAKTAARAHARPAPPREATAAPEPPAEADGCTPPFYYEGSKKVFKADCL